jgi:hypothetical protein
MYHSTYGCTVQHIWMYSITHMVVKYETFGYTVQHIWLKVPHIWMYIISHMDE